MKSDQGGTSVKSKQASHQIQTWIFSHPLKAHKGSSDSTLGKVLDLHVPDLSSFPGISEAPPGICVSTVECCPNTHSKVT